MTTGRAPTRSRSLLPVLLTLAVGAGATVVIAMSDALRFAYQNEELRVASETTVALLALAVGASAYLRYRATRDRRDLIVTVAIFVFSYANMVYAAVPLLIGGTDTERFAVWAPLSTRAIGATLLAAAPWAAGRIVGRAAAGWRVAFAAFAALSVGFLLAFVPQLPRGVTVTVPIESSTRPRFDAHPVIIAVEVLVAVLFAIAAIGSIRVLRRRPDDSFWLWLGIGAAWQAVSRVQFASFPSLYTEWFYVGDVFRLIGYVAWLIGVGTEIRRVEVDRARLAVYDERRRMARELHDGLVQDLSFIHSQTASRRAPDAEMMEHVASTARRALDEARLAVAALGEGVDGTDDVPPEIALRSAAERMAAPAGISVTCSFQPHAIVPAAVRHDLARIVQEAASNAAKHSGASSISVDLDRPPGGGLWLMVSDDGAGFDTDAVNGDGFGLTSMRERAERIGGRLTIHSSPGEGTVVEVLVEPEDLP